MIGSNGFSSIVCHEKRSCFLALFVFLAAVTYADIALEPLQKGFNPVKKKGRQVRMVSEEVQVILSERRTR